MKDASKTKEQLIDELAELRRRNANLEASEVAGKRRVAELTAISETTIALSRCQNADEICQLIGETVYEFNSSAYVVVSLFDRAINAVRIKAYLGFNEYMKRILGIMGRDPREMSFFPAGDTDDVEAAGDHLGFSEDEWRLFTSGKLELVHDGIYALMARQIPRNACKAVERLVGIDKVYAIGFTFEGKPYGAVMVMTRKGKPVEYKFAIETLANYSSVAIYRKQAEEELRKSEEKYRVLIENANEVVLVAQDGMLKFVNPKATELTGYSKDELMSRSFVDFVHPDDRETVVELYLRRLKGEETPHIYLVRIIDKDGNTKWVEAGVTSITWEGRPATMNFLTEITERKQAEQEIRAKSQFLERLIQQSPLPTFVLDEKGILLMVNKAFLEYSSVPDEDVILGRNALTEPMNVKHGVVKYIEEALSGKVVETPEIEFLSPFSDEATVVKSRLFPVFDPDGELTNVVVMHEDITERMKAEEALRESEASYRELADSIVDIFFAFDENMRYTYWNRASEELTGIPAKDAIGKPLHDLFPDTPQTGRAERIYLDVLRTQQAQSFVNEYQFGGKDFVFEISAYPAKRGISVFVRDITERKRMEEELIKAQKLESVGILAGGIAHDFNNIMTAIVGNISLARMYEDPEDKDRRLADAERACMQVRDLTHQLLTFSKGGAPIRITASIAEMLRDSAIFALSGSNVRCEFSIPDHLWPVEVDQGQMNQVINNIVINAGQAMPNGGIVRICAENITIGTEPGLPLEPGAYIKVSIEDQGVGIPREHLQQIFDPYFTTKQKGSGLGLAAAYSVVKKHDGHIAVESEVDAGTTFHIYLPASSEAILVVERKDEEKPIRGDGRILVMDDEKYVRDVAAEVLSSIGYEVITTIDGAAAIELYEEAMVSGNTFDAVILDLTVPGGMGGKETILRLVKIDPEVKAMVSSGYSNDPIMADFRMYGFKGVIAKPYNARELSEVLHRMITENAQ